MGQVTLRPELVTASGEACGIMLDDQYVGSLTLLYRENDRIWGSVQLDEEVLHGDEKEEVDLFIHRYIENMIDAVGAPECFVSTTFSPYDHIISTDNVGEIEELVSVESIDYEENEDTRYLEDTGVDFDEDYGDYETVTDEDLEVIEYDYDYDLHDDYQLNIVGESRNRVEYQLLNKNHEIVAEAMMYIDQSDVYGDIFWHFEPSEEDIDEVTHIVVADFDQYSIDTFEFNMYFGDEEIARIELLHEDLTDDALEHDDDLEDYDGFEDEDDEEIVYVDVYEDSDVNLHFELIRDDIDSMTFDIYEEEDERDTRIGTATIDLAGEEPSAWVDFVQPGDLHMREQIAYHLIDQLDSETDYTTFTITMQYMDETIDEFEFDVREQRRKGAAHRTERLQYV